jgi:hypothetical protein
MNPPNGQSSLDYLNQIAPQAPKKAMFELNLRNIIFLGLIAVGIIVGLAMIVGALTSSSKEPWQRLSARLDATAIISESATSNIKNSELRSVNSTLKLYIANTKRELATPLAQLEIVPAKLPPRILKEESSELIMSRLENGRLNAKYDTTYSREMSYLLATILALLERLQASSGEVTKKTLQAAHNDLSPIYKSVSSFDAVTE